MPTVYVLRQGTTLKRTNNNLAITRGKHTLEKLPIETIDRLVLLGNVTIAPSAVQLILGNGIDTIFISWNGRYLGRLNPVTSKNVFLRLRQYNRMQDIAFRLRIAKNIVMAKISNQLSIIESRIKSRGGNKRTKKAASMLRELIKRSESAASLDMVRGFEGRAGAIYFKAFGNLLRNKDFIFINRNRRPPKDPVNVLLSLGYTLLVTRILKEIESVGLDPAVGCFHELSYGRPSLVLDIEEEFRAPVVDNLVLNSCNRRLMRIVDFYFSDQVAEDAVNFPEFGFSKRESPVVLTFEGYKKFITLFENRCTMRVYEKDSQNREELSKIIKKQVKKFVKAIKGEDEYKPFIWDIR